MQPSGDSPKKCSRRIRRRKVPVLAVAGEQDHAYSIELSENIAKKAENGRCEVVGKAGHSVALEKDEEVNKVLEKHFTRIKAHTTR